MGTRYSGNQPWECGNECVPWRSCSDGEKESPETKERTLGREQAARGSIAWIGRVEGMARGIRAYQPLVGCRGDRHGACKARKGAWLQRTSGALIERKAVCSEHDYEKTDRRSVRPDGGKR